MTTALNDPIWPRAGVVLRHKPDHVTLPRDHVMRGLDEFARMEDDQNVFDPTAFDRVLRGYVTPDGLPEPTQFFQGARLKLPHFTASRVLSAKRIRIITRMWGSEGKPAPIMSWADVNEIAATSYQSFDDAFDGKAAREDVLELVTRGKYRLRRHP